MLKKDVEMNHIDEKLTVPMKSDHRPDENGLASKSDSLLGREAPHRSRSAERMKTNRKNDKNNQIYKSAIILFGVLNILLLVLNALAGYYLASEKPPPQPTSRLCVQCQDIKGHPDDVKTWKHIVQENDTCCLDAPKHLNYLVEYYTERWMKTRLTNSNKTFQYCKDRNGDEFRARPSIKVMGFSEPQIHSEHHRMQWDQNNVLALVPDPKKIQYLEDDAQIAIKQAGVYHVYSQVHFDHKQNNSSHQPVVFSHMIYMKKAGTSTGHGTIVMRSRETECESEDPRVVGSSYLASSLQLEDGDRLYLNT
ncbi:hypothetical protein MAR_022635 [Mya arenaria]|uniref:THD domain-containing protein n=1 Tax=Mya arenaria TaxID=6604 RepID=A0ABY7DKL6_MYAAR|nr:hypothetical protein MAR_022635 [Mya arenaria]